MTQMDADEPEERGGLFKPTQRTLALMALGAALVSPGEVPVLRAPHRGIADKARHAARRGKKSGKSKRGKRK